MKHTSYSLVSIFLLISQVTFANTTGFFSSIFVKDGSLLVILLAALAVLRVSYVLLNKE